MFSRLTIALLSFVFCLGLTAANGTEPMADQPASKQNIAPTAALLSSPADQVIKSVLAVETTSLDVCEQPLSEWITYLSDRFHFPIQFDSNSLKDTSIDPATVPVGVQVLVLIVLDLFFHVRIR